MRIPTVAFLIVAMALYGTAAHLAADTLNSAYHLIYGFGLAFISLFGVHIPITYAVTALTGSETARKRSIDAMTVSAFVVGGLAGILLGVADPHNMVRPTAVTLLIAAAFFVALFGLHPVEPTKEETA